jgi:hypothetical protein
MEAEHTGILPPRFNNILLVIVTIVGLVYMLIEDLTTQFIRFRRGGLFTEELFWKAESCLKRAYIKHLESGDKTNA